MTESTIAGMPPAKIEIRNLNIYYGDFRAVKDITLNIPEGCVTAFIGPSGCGKSTLLRSLNRMYDLYEGQRAEGFCRMGDTDILGKETDVTELRSRIGMVFQEPKLLPWKTVAENVALAVRHLPEKERNDRVLEVLERVGLSAWKDALPGFISGGMAQRAGLARALVSDPALLLMDEPFGALDALTRLTLQDECLRLFAKSDMTVFLITHDAREAVRLADRILVLDEGAITLDMPLTLSQPRAPEDPALAAAERMVLDAIFRRDATR